MPSILILFAHPLLEKSRIHRELLRYAAQVPNVTINDLYERYPEFDIDIKREQRLLLKHDIIIWQHPFYWYSAPSLLKQWQDLVLEHGWAYGQKGTALAGKKIFNVLSSGAGTETYQPGGFNKYSIHDYLRPYQRTAELCRMTYWPPYWISGAHIMNEEMIQQHGRQYKKLLTTFITGVFTEVDILQYHLMNELFSITSTGQ